MAERRWGKEVFALQFPHERKMDKSSLRRHIAELERRVQQLSQEMMRDQKTRPELNRKEAELRVVQQALEDYQHAKATAPRTPKETVERSAEQNPKRRDD
jgi:hypothetical protein